MSKPRPAARQGPGSVCRLCVLALLLARPPEAPAQDQDRLHLSSTVPSRSFLQRSSIPYRNFAHDSFANYPDHAFPYQDLRRAFYGPMGDRLITGYDLYHWIERRPAGKGYGSVVTADLNIFQPVFDHLVVGRDHAGIGGSELGQVDG